MRRERATCVCSCASFQVSCGNLPRAQDDHAGWPWSLSPQTRASVRTMPCLDMCRGYQHTHISPRPPCRRHSKPGVSDTRVEPACRGQGPSFCCPPAEGDEAVPLEAEVAVTGPQVKERPGLPEPPGARREATLPTPGSALLASRTVGKKNPLVLSGPCCGPCHGGPGRRGHWLAPCRPCRVPGNAWVPSVPRNSEQASPPEQPSPVPASKALGQLCSISWREQAPGLVPVLLRSDVSPRYQRLQVVPILAPGHQPLLPSSPGWAPPHKELSSPSSPKPPSL